MTKEDVKFLLKAHAEKLLKRLADGGIKNIEIQEVTQKLHALATELDNGK